MHQYEDGPAIPENYTYLPGEIVHFSVQIANYKAAKDHQVRLSYRIDALDPAGVKIVETESGVIDTDVSREDKNWMPKLRHMVPLPPLADTGEYQLVVMVTDEIAKTKAEGSYTLSIKGRDVEPSETLVVRNFRFLRSEEDRNPLRTPTYRPGDAVWARFEITGYRFGERNRFAVDYGLAILRPDGKVLYSEEKAAEETDESFYPKRYVSGVLNLMTRPDTGLGEYTLVVTVRDSIGNQTHESRYEFRVE
ncbi:MAG: hypothetical protein ACK5AZ_25555 [Bryobacteraceae bacterium]